MAVTFDSAFEKGSAATSSPFSFVSNAGTVSGTVGSNSNRILLATVFFTGSVSLFTSAAMTWNGVSMTAIGSVDIPGGSFSVFLFGLINPATGNNTLSCSWPSGTPGVYVGATSVYNADQSTGWQNFGTDTGTGTSASSSITTANGNMGFVGHGNANATSTTQALGTQSWKDTTNNGNAAEAYLASVSGTDVISWTLGSSVGWGHVKVDIIQFGGGAATDVLDWKRQYDNNAMLHNYAPIIIPVN